MGLLDYIYRYGQPAATMLSGVVAQPVSGLVGLMTGGDVGAMNAVKDSMTYQPSTPQGQSGLQALSNFLNSAKQTMVDNNPPVNMAVNGWNNAQDWVGSKSPLSGALMAAAPAAAMSFFGPGSGATRSAFSNVAGDTAQGIGVMMNAAYQNAGAVPAVRGPLTGQGGAVKLGDMTKIISGISDIRSLLQDENGPLYVRWSAGPQYDMKPGALSRDYLSGGSHNGLSAVPLSNDMEDAQIAKYLDEYRFLRIKDPGLKPHIYRGDVVGTDSDGYPSISPSAYVGTLDKRFIDELSDDLFVKKLKLSDSIKSGQTYLKSGKGDATGRQFVQNRINKEMLELEQLNNSR